MVGVSLFFLSALSEGATKPKSSIECEVVYLRDEGFFPRVLNRPAGPFLLIVKNLSKAPSVSLSFRDQKGSDSFAPLALTARSQDFLLTLGSGQYQLTDLSQKQLQPVVITVK